MSPHTLLIKVPVEDAARNSFGVAVIQPLDLIYEVLANFDLPRVPEVQHLVQHVSPVPGELECRLHVAGQRRTLAVVIGLPHRRHQRCPPICVQ
jgi:hypothetical protein